MKKTNFVWKKLIGLVLACTMLFAVIPVQAASSKISDIEYYYDTDSNTETVFYYSTSADKYANESVLISFIENSSTTTVKNLKSSKKSVATVKKTRTKISSGVYYTQISLVAKKAGTTTISFKAGSETYSIKVTVKKFKASSVISYVKVGSKKISASKFKNSRSYNLSYSTFLNKKVKLTIKPASGWKVEGLYFMYGLASDGVSTQQKVYSKANRTLTLKYKKATGFYPSLNWKLTNESTGQTELITVYFK